jgi:hypothetical protein
VDEQVLRAADLEQPLYATQRGERAAAPTMHAIKTPMAM